LSLQCPVFCHLSSPSPGSLVQAALTQPASKTANPGDTVQITCSGSSDNYYGWYQQKTPGSAPVTVIYDDTRRPSGIPSPFSASTNTLTIPGVQAEDKAVYYCGSSDSTGGVSVMQGDAVQKLVLASSFPTPLFLGDHFGRRSHNLQQFLRTFWERIVK
uniref:Ig-like domain-containing protein n=1 Tax=Anas zonorhyncha TaxID=75864 RepID=A0A8B9W2K9_9AVES